MAAIAKFVSYDGGIAFSDTVVKIQKRESSTGTIIPLSDVILVAVRMPQPDSDGYIYFQIVGEEVYGIFFDDSQCREALHFERLFNEVLSYSLESTANAEPLQTTGLTRHSSQNNTYETGRRQYSHTTTPHRTQRDLPVQETRKSHTVKKIIFWVLFVFMVSGAAIFFPSIGSLLLLLGGIVILPLDAWQHELALVRVRGKLKTSLFIVLLFAGVMLTPEQGIEVAPSADMVSSAFVSVTAIPTTPEPTSIPTIAPTDVPTAMPTVVPTAAPTSVPISDTSAYSVGNISSMGASDWASTATVAPASTTELTYNGYPASTTVYVSNSGHKIHLRNNCSGMKYYSEMSLGTAISNGYEKCKNCF